MNYIDAPLNERPTILQTYQEFVQAITKAFGDTNPVTNAESALRALRQTGPVSLYATEFRRISLNLKWNDDALMSQYKLN
ncbi:hypothetical protein, partial [Salmonella enterica]|uniref:hypothetical protein n=1 Tax=Salmonella enterica TaxID=28901 RepID=UPI001E2C0D09